MGGSREILLARLEDGGMELPDENEMRSTETSICLKQAAMKNSNDVALPPRIVKSREPVMKYRIHRTSGIGCRYQHADGYEEALEASLRVAYDRNSLEPVVLHFADGSSFRTCMTQAEYAAKYSGCQEYDTELLVHCKKE